jgi:hypothetical protein
MPLYCKPPFAAKVHRDPKKFRKGCDPASSLPSTASTPSTMSTTRVPFVMNTSLHPFFREIN